VKLAGKDSIPANMLFDISNPKILNPRREDNEEI
jgi:hypothetical protein